MFTNDTNILVYSIDTTDHRKHDIARRIITSHSNHRFPTLLQSLTEFYYATTRKSLLSNAEAARFLHRFIEISPIIEASQRDVLEGMRLHDQTKHQFFDCLLLATAARSGCTTLFTEDFQTGRTYDSITVINPFLLTTGQLDLLLA